MFGHFTLILAARAISSAEVQALQSEMRAAVADAHPMRVMRSGELRRTVVGSSSGGSRWRTINEAGDGTMRANGRGIA